MHVKRLLIAGTALVAWTGTAAAQEAAQAAPAEAVTETPTEAATDEGAMMGDIVVTAQRRSESINSVPMSITAATASQLSDRGVASIADIGKISPGLTYTQTAYATPVFTLRGIGFNENTLAAAPNVAVYVDEVPLPFPSMTSGALLDPQRVEVLKGPQGLLYGQNSTGGAINFIAAKPGDHFQAGLTTSIERFGLFQADGFMGGPMSDTLGVRISASTAQGGAWQRSYTRDDSLGNQNTFKGRILFDWKPSDSVRFTLNANGWTDQSDTQAGQKFASRAANPARVVPGVINYPNAPADARAADWTPGREFARDNRFWQFSLRGDIDISSNVTLTSISAYSNYKHEIATDTDATAFDNFDAFIHGDIKSAYQEVRLVGDTAPLKWIVGANYANDKVYEYQLYDFGSGSTRFIGGAPNVEEIATYSRQKIETVAAFGQVTYEITPTLKAEAGARYTNTSRDFRGCTADSGNNLLTAGGVALQRIFNPNVAPTPIAPGGCVTMNAQFKPGLITGELNEDNVSWRGGLTWTPASGSLLYANVSRGYKQGSFPTLNAFFAAQYEPAKQEKLTAYEIGFKQSLFGRAVQINGAGFYYDYGDKQIRGRQLDPVAGSLVKLLNIPHSRAVGGELSTTIRPVDGLTLSAQGTYIDTKIRDYTFYNNFGVIEDFSGDPYPFTSKFSGNADAEYKLPISETAQLFIGGTATWQTDQRSALGDATFWDIPGYTLFDLRAGVESRDGRWKAMGFVRNVGDKYYWYNALYSLDTFFRLAGRPRTFGLSLSYRYDK